MSKKSMDSLSATQIRKIKKLAVKIHGEGLDYKRLYPDKLWDHCDWYIIAMVEDVIAHELLKILSINELGEPFKY